MKKLSSVIILSVLCFAGCGEKPGDGGGGDNVTVFSTMTEITEYLAAAEGGASPGNPVPLAVDIDASKWLELTTLIGTGSKYVDLDLTRCRNVPAVFPKDEDRHSYTYNWWYKDPADGGANCFLPKVVSVSMPAGITTLNDGVFLQCYDLRRVTLHGGLESVRFEAFHVCTNLETVTFRAATPPVIDEIFRDNNPGLKIKVPKNSVNAYKTAPGWGRYADRISAI
jgi:hypothetical protein